ncbi:hypothetical protein DFA_10488 [Cavenderia fasciculata]|uniref:Uncharacterized protein n=1 Tax=Cavenderia fasciculata TaxID=261658 RepID=F4QAC7_CACFS|nr:uncharacterized protein DFA_10488 [Cavenderia fasciculata]EGG15646.1 hypothetical protein DFA_10488 [Cavenderia fasciculata]|eukprot:XP_004354388.1 hypothetical protein DFA_10488 [Cavenderia fasciculata]
MTTNNKRYYKTFGLEKADKEYLLKQELYNLYKTPKRDSFTNMPHIQEYTDNFKQQADLLFLPDDNGFKYALVVVDLASRLTDAEPLQNKTAKETRHWNDGTRDINWPTIKRMGRRLACYH